MVRSLHMLTACCALASASLAEAKVPNDITWGKPGVPVDQYAQDTTACADTSQSVPVTIKPDTLRQMDGMSSAQLLNIARNMGGGHRCRPDGLCRRAA